MKGKWIDARDYCGEFLCSNCHETNINNSYKYCPNCGAKMEDLIDVPDDPSRPFADDVMMQPEIIRCADCRYYTDGWYCDMHHMATDPDDYCSYAGR